MSVVRSLAGCLHDRGEQVRVLIPPSEADGWPENVVLHVGTVTDPAAFAAAASGSERVFLAGLVGEFLQPLRALTNALVANGISRVVRLGPHGSDFEDEISEETWQWSAFERSLDTHEWAGLRPTAVMANAVVGGYPIPGAAAVETIMQCREIHEYLPDAPYAFIHEHDLAEIAAALLLGNAYRGTVEVSGTTVSATERLAALGSALGIEGAAGRTVPGAGRGQVAAGGMARGHDRRDAPRAARLRRPIRQSRAARAGGNGPCAARAPRTFRQWANELADGSTSPRRRGDVEPGRGLPERDAAQAKQ
ncbi:hypothetical protein SACE_3283 [Saccharopolyspora erythraea NRRL 2338]|uniref:NAD(P)-binding domain-containing protein n=1 Tax=Saccharopolyspora erythraea (strain ATCC 11635 / DSM 40517 / JCM 4748 / NBRC 13426 / NCIMB 8594 / NRRL 2338) TaxID=405948 RepID=A4FET3_SACEN|nr:hypothetical protein SACE_3283 [Saccharopolyspora erythraea NRRL 2338]